MEMAGMVERTLQHNTITWDTAEVIEGTLHHNSLIIMADAAWMCSSIDGFFASNIAQQDSIVDARGLRSVRAQRGRTTTSSSIPDG